VTLSPARRPRQRNRNVAGCATETVSIRGNSLMFLLSRRYLTGKRGLILFHSLRAHPFASILKCGPPRRQRLRTASDFAVEAARARFRPILMTSFAFILGVVPLVLASGAGASARRSIGITVFSGMIASTCLAVLFVPTFFVVVQRFENWLGARKTVPAPHG
jgi:HAE1 family hydrophobic/amphiphilic exporter-1